MSIDFSLDWLRDRLARLCMHETDVQMCNPQLTEDQVLAVVARRMEEEDAK